MTEPAKFQSPEELKQEENQNIYDAPGNVPIGRTIPAKSESTKGLADKEKTNGGNFTYSPKGDKSAKNGSSTSSNSVGNIAGARNFGASKIYSKVLGSKKKKGGVGGALIAMVLLFFLFFLQGPFEVIQFAQMLQRFHFASDENFMDGRTSKLIKHMRTAKNPQNRNLDYFGNKFADHFEKKLKKNGMTAEYNKSARISAIIIDSKTDAGKKTIRALQEQGLKLDGSDPNIKYSNGKYTVDVSGTSARYRRNMVGTMVKSQGINHAATHISSRLLKTRAGVGFHPLKNITRAVDEKLRTYYEKVQKDRATRIRKGVYPSARGVAGDPGVDKNGKPIVDPNTPEGVNGANDVLNGVDGQAAAERKAASLVENLNKPAGALAFVTLLCGIKAISEAISELRYANVVLPLIRTGMEIVTTGSQVQAGKDINLDELGAISDNFYDEETKTSWSQARSIQAEMGEKQTGPDIPESAKPGNQKPRFFLLIDAAFSVVVGASTVCKAINSTIGGWLVTGLGNALGATGPVGFAFRVITDVLVGYALQPFIQDIIKWLAGQQVPADAAGALLGNFANYGTRLAANDVAITHGGTALSSTVTQELKNENNALLAAEFSHKSVFARVLDLNEPNSAISQFMLKNHIPSNGQSMVATINKFPGFIGNMVSAFDSVMHPQAFAAATPYDYGFPAYGYAPDEIDNPAYDDPYANAAIVEPKLAALNTAYGEPCFGVTIDPTTHAIVTSEESTKNRYVNQSKDPAIETKCNDRTNIELTQYRFYLADMSAAKAIACYESLDEDACAELGFGVNSSSPIPANTGPTTSTGSVDMAAASQASTACAPRTKDLGVYTGYQGGSPVQIRLCSLPNLPCSNEECNGGYGIKGADGTAIVNAAASGAFFNLVEAANAALPSGLKLSANSTFRTYEHQAALCPCDGVTVARPGYSNHQMGLAIDFDIKGISESRSSCITVAGKCTASGHQDWEWLDKNSSSFGLSQYINEFWHFSPSGN